MRRNETDRFEAEADDGERCTIVEYTAKVARRTLTPGDRNYVTSAGRAVALISNRYFRDVASAKMFTRIEV